MREKLKLLDLFSGVGGFSLGLERTGGFKTVAFCEIDPFCRKVLNKHWPGVPIYEDVRQLTADVLARDGIAVDVICGGFPCQNISIAGAAWGVDVGIEGDRSGLWSEYARLIGETAPQIVVIENVDRLVSHGLHTVLHGLAALGYDAEWEIVPGWFVGAPQARKRIWIVSYPRGEREQGLLQGIDPGKARPGWPGGAANLCDIADSPFHGNGRFPQPLIRGVDDRPSNWVDRVGACGNAVVPQIPELIGNAILASMKQQEAA